MTSSLPDMSGLGPSASPPTTPLPVAHPASTRVRTPRPTPAPARPAWLLPVLIATTVVVSGGAAVAVAVSRHSGPSGTVAGGGDGSGTYVGAPPAGLAYGACLDRSGSLGDRGRLAAQALANTTRFVSTLVDPKATVRQYQPFGGLAGAQVVVKLIRRNSYETASGSKYGALVHIPPVSGVTKPMPSDSTELAQWTQAHASAQKQLGVAKQARAAGLTQLAALRSVGSDGSDISGCVSAELNTLQGAQRSLLVVSDLEDTATAEPDGRPRLLDGRFGDARLVVVAACPNGSPGTCDQRRRTFLRGMARLGLQPGRVQVFRPEQLDAAMTAWLR